MKAVMIRDISERELFLGKTDYVILQDGQTVQIIDRQTTGTEDSPMECYAVKINPALGRPYVWVNATDLRIVA